MANGEIKFNDDLLMNAGDQETARESFPSLEFALIFPDLQEAFEEIDAKANAAKASTIFWGRMAVVLAFFALAVAAIETVYHDALKGALISGVDVSWGKALVIAAGIAGVISIVISALGLFFGASKASWLRYRFLGERLRQLHFQTLIMLYPQLEAAVEGGEAEREAFDHQRRAALALMQREVIGRRDTAFEIATQDDTAQKAWLSSSSKPVITGGTPAFDAFCDAYRVLRIDHQIRYADYKLDGGSFFGANTPYRQKQLLNGLTVLAVIYVFAVHLAVLAKTIFGFDWFPVDLFGLSIGEREVHVSVVIVALFALALRAFEGGLRPEAELERYRQYRSYLKLLQQRFLDDKAPPAQKVAVMHDLEELTYAEMVTFLRTNDEASYVM